MNFNNLFQVIIFKKSLRFLNQTSFQNRSCSSDLAVCLTIRGSIPGRGKRIFLFQNLHTSLGAHPATYPVATEIKGPRRGANHFPPTNAENRNEWIYTSTHI
jgi:hypothetical protein